MLQAINCCNICKQHWCNLLLSCVRKIWCFDSWLRFSNPCIAKQPSKQQSVLVPNLPHHSLDIKSKCTYIHSFSCIQYPPNCTNHGWILLSIEQQSRYVFLELSNHYYLFIHQSIDIIVVVALSLSALTTAILRKASTLVQLFRAVWRDQNLGVFGEISCSTIRLAK